MLKLHQLFFRNFLTVFIAAFIITGVIGYFFLKSVEMNQYIKHLKNSIGMLEFQLKKSQNYDLLAENVKKSTDMRLTVIALSGLVVAESDRDKSEMDNHARRLEVRKAEEEEYGISVRYSQSLDQEFLYVVKRVETPNQTLFLRLAVSLSSIMENFYSLWIKVTLFFAFLLMLAFFINFRMSRHIKYDVEALMYYLTQVSEKNYRAPLRAHFALEFVTIATHIKSVIAKLQRREKQRRKYTAKLKLVNKQRNDLLSAISHEFKNPLAAIQGYAQTLLAEEPTEENRALYEKFLHRIEDNSKKISTMLDRIALSVKLEHNDIALDAQKFDLGHLIEDAVATLKKKYPDREIHFDYQAHQVRMDKTMIELVLINLLENALKYSQKDVEVKLDEKRVSVIDQGIGIDAKELDKISKKFYRVDKNSWDNSMGLGLAIVSFILNLHRTKLDVQSSVGTGSVFSFKLHDL